jgi:protein-tyrosine phosphatase
MRLGAFFVSLAMVLFAASASMPPVRGWLLFWAATSLLIVGLGYLGLGSRVFGKRPDGTLALGSAVLLLPYLLCVWGIWRLRRLLSSRRPFHELPGDILIGRRLFPSEYPPQVDHVLDLTCEFPEFRAVRRSRQYRCFPILDGHVPPLSELVELIRRVSDVEGTLYVHCAEGHGRAAMVSATILLARGLATDPHEAVRIVRAKRPGVLLRRRQRQMVADVARVLTSNAADRNDERGR